MLQLLSARKSTVSYRNRNAFAHAANNSVSIHYYADRV